jgi:hypothetical protein
MPLWKKEDTYDGAPKYLKDPDDYPVAVPERDYGGLPMQESIANAYLVDSTEAVQAENRAKGVKTPGWILYKEYGNGRKYVETLVPFKVSALLAGDEGVANTEFGDDAVLVDRTITITVQPANVSVEEPDTANFTVTAASSPVAVLAYQWQIQQSGTGAWANVTTGTGGTTASYTTDVTAVTAGAGATNGDKYRVIVSASGATSVTSNAATLTVTAAT